MKRLEQGTAVAALLAAAWLLAAIPDAQADLSLIGHSQVSALNRPSRSQEALYIKKDWLRRDLIDSGRRYSYLYDLKRKELTVVDHLLRQAEIRKLDEDVRKKGVDMELKLELSTTGRKHALQHWECIEHQLDARLPGTMGQESVTVSLTGQVWLAGHTEEQRLINPFIKTIPAQDLFVGVPVQGRAAPTQVQGVNEVLRRILPKGMLCAAEIRIDYEGAGPMANLARRMQTRVSLVYENLSDAALQDELFKIPEEYQVIKAKKPAEQRP